MADSDPTLSLVLRGTFAVLGLSSLVAGGLAVFITDNGTGAAALLTVGAALTLLGLLGDRLEGLELGSAKLRLRAAAAAKYEQAEALDLQGDSGAAEALRTQARALLEVADPLAARYATVRATNPAGPDRTRAMEQVVQDAKRSAARGDFEPQHVIRWLREGNDERRIVALGMMQERKELRDVNLILDAIASSHSAFEQYQAMKLAVDMIDDLDSHQCDQLANIVAEQRSRLRFRRDSGRAHLAEKITHRLLTRAGG